MAKTIRFSISALLGIIITAGLFMGMLGLLKEAKTTTSGDDVNVNFSFVRDFKEPVVTPDKPKDIPEPKKVTQPPAAPQLTTDVISDPIPSSLPGLSEANRFNLIGEISIPGTGTGLGGGYNADNPGVIKVAIAPIYPQAALISKTEGWVKLQITVDEFGGVGAVSIVDAEPKRVFNAAAKRSIKKWKFHPKMVDGQAVSFVATQTIEFKINE